MLIRRGQPGELVAVVTRFQTHDLGGIRLGTERTSGLMSMVKERDEERYVHVEPVPCSRIRRAGTWAPAGAAVRAVRYTSAP